MVLNCPPGDIYNAWRHLLSLKLRRGKARDAAKHLTMHRTAPTQRVIQSKKSILPRLRNPVRKQPSLTPSPAPSWLASAAWLESHLTEVLCWDKYVLAGDRGWGWGVTGKVLSCILSFFYKSGHITLLPETLNGFLLHLLQNTDSFPWLAGPGSADPILLAASPHSLYSHIGQFFP